MSFPPRSIPSSSAAPSTTFSLSILNGQNVALIPNTSIPVAINTVNAGANAQFFVDNYTNPLRQIQMDGLTTVLTITAFVNPGQINHIKLAIADTSDQVLDSNVFIKAGSFAAPKEPKLKVYNPVRFIFNKKTKTYDGSFTLINTGTADQTAPLFVIFKKLPKGAFVANLTGVSKAGLAYIRINKNANIGVPVRLLVKIKNPLHKPLNGYLRAQNLEFSATAP